MWEKLELFIAHFATSLIARWIRLFLKILTVVFVVISQLLIDKTICIGPSKNFGPGLGCH